MHSIHAPSSFYPRDAYPKGMVAENRIAPDVIEALRERGHEVTMVDGWVNGRCLGTAVQVAAWKAKQPPTTSVCG